MSDKPATVTAHLIAFPLGVACSFYCAHIMTYWWLWFVVPLGVPAIGTIHAWALTFVTWFLTRGLALGIIERTKLLPEHSSSTYVIGRPIAISVFMTLGWGVLYILQRLM